MRVLATVNWYVNFGRVSGGTFSSGQTLKWGAINPQFRDSLLQCFLNVCTATLQPLL